MTALDWQKLTDYVQCSCCNEPLDGYVQRFDAKYNIPDKVYVTCRNQDCGMWDLTYRPEAHQDECGKKLAVES